MFFKDGNKATLNSIFKSHAEYNKIIIIIILFSILILYNIYTMSNKADNVLHATLLKNNS